MWKKKYIIRLKSGTSITASQDISDRLWQSSSWDRFTVVYHPVPELIGLKIYIPREAVDYIIEVKDNARKESTTRDF